MIWQFEHLTTWEKVCSSGFQDVWRHWFTKPSVSHVFLHPTLAMAWIESYRAVHDILPRFIVARNANCTVFTPFVLWRRNWKNAWLRVLIPVGNSDFDYHDPLVVGNLTDGELSEYWEKLLEEVQSHYGRQYDRLDISGIRGRFGDAGWTTDDLCPWCDLAPFADIASFLAALGKALRNDLNRQQRRLSQHGAIVLHVYQKHDTVGMRKALGSLLLHHARRWPKAYKAPRFHERLMESAASADLLHFSELRVGGRAVSWHLGFQHNRRYYYYMPAYDPDFRDFSPGKIHLLFCVKDAIESGMTSFDHLRGEENYKNGWTQNVSDIYSFSHRQSSLGSRVRLGLAGLREIW